MAKLFRILIPALIVGGISLVSAPFATAAEEASDSVGVVDTKTGVWYLRTPDSGATTSFYFGDPGDFPFSGDWDCDGVDTPGLYRQSDGYVYLRNTNTQGVADVTFFFGNPGDVPIAGDFDGDGCDTVSIYRPSNQTFYVINELGEDGGGLGFADYSFLFGNPGDKPFVGDLDDDGIDEVGLHRASNGIVYYRDTLTSGAAHAQFTFGNPGDVLIAGDWTQRGESASDAVGAFRPGNGTMYLRFSNTAGFADAAFVYGNASTKPVVGDFGPLPGGDAPPAQEIHLLSRFTTFHACCEARVTNIQVMAALADGWVVPAGEVFNLNEMLGARTADKGYVAAPILLNGQGYCCDHPLNIGGGTSQFATTIYGAIFFGGLEDILHRPHSRYITRYPAGLEATIGYDPLNIIFRNDYDFPLTIRTSHTGTSITVSFYGNNNGRTMVGSHSGGTTRAWIVNSGDVSARKVTWSIAGAPTWEDGGFVTVRRWLTTNGVTNSQTWTWNYQGD